MKRFFQNIHVTVKKKLILAFSLVLIIPSLTVGTLAYFSAKDNTEDQLMNEAEANVHLMSQIISNNIKPQIDDMAKLSNDITEKNLKGKQASQLKETLDQYKYFHDKVDAIYVGTNSGELIHAPDIELDDDFDPRTRPWYEDAVQDKGETVITTPYEDTSTGEMMITISMTTTDNSGVIGIDLPVTTIDAMAKAGKVGKDGYVMILDESNNFVSHPDEDSGSEAKESFYKKLYKSNSGQFEYTLHNKGKQMFFTTDETTGWKIAGSMYDSEVTKSAQPIMNYIIVVLVVALLLGAIIVYFITRSIVKPLNTLNQAALKISHGDLTERISISSQDEFGELSNSFNDMSDHLQKVIHEVEVSAEQVAASSEELTASAEQTSDASEHVSEGIQQVASGAEAQENGLKQNAETLATITDGIGRVAENALSVSKLTQDARIQAEKGGETVQQSVEQMKSLHQSVKESNTTILSLNDRSKEIESIIDVIVGISDQTNLLALNAAIEAARAGESGKGFTVVANEVRKLAEQSQQSANQISDLISNIQIDTQHSVTKMETASVNVENGMTLSNETADSFNQVIKSVRDIAPQIEDVAEIAEQISNRIQEVTRTATEHADVARDNAAASEEIAASTEEQLASMEEISSASRALSSLAESLQTLISQFRI